MSLYSFAVALFSYGSLTTMIFVLIKRRDQVAILFSIFSVIICAWGFIFSFLISQAYSEQTTLFLAQLAYIFVVSIPSTWMHFLFAFTRQKQPFKYFLILNYVLTFVFISTCFTPLMFTGMHAVMDFKYLPTPGVVHHIHVIHFFCIVPYGYKLLGAAYQSAARNERNHILLFMIASGVGFLGGSTIYLPYYGIPFPWNFHLLMPIYPLLTGIALMRYGLFDVNVVIDAFRREKLAALGTISASINHEIRNPLYVVNGLAEAYIEKLDEGSSKDFKNASREAMEKISDQSRRAMDIIKRFSSFAKQNVDVEFNPEFVDLSEALKTVVPLVHHELDTSDIVLTEQVSSDLPKVKVDLRHLEEILFNLIVNGAQAIKGAEKPGEIKIIAHVERNEVVIEVSDNGPGIVEDNLNQVFEPFHTSKDEGTGLGLYITKQLVEKNGGRLKVESTLGKCTTFSVRFIIA